MKTKVNYHMVLNWPANLITLMLFNQTDTVFYVFGIFGSTHQISLDLIGIVLSILGIIAVKNNQKFASWYSNEHPVWIEGS